MGKGNKPEECKRSGRRIQEGIWARRKKNRKRTEGNARKIHSKITI